MGCAGSWLTWGRLAPPPEFAVLMRVARERLHEGQQAFDLCLDWRDDDAASAGGAAADALVVGTASQVLWEVPEGAHMRLGFGVVADEALFPGAVHDASPTASATSSATGSGSAGRRRLTPLQAKRRPRQAVNHAES